MFEVLTKEKLEKLRPLHRKFCLSITARRISLGLTQQEVADRMGVSRSTYAGYEVGLNSTGLGPIEDIATALETDAWKLFR